MKIVEKQIRRIFPRFDTKPCLVEKQEKKKERNGSSRNLETKRDRNNRYSGKLGSHREVDGGAESVKRIITRVARLIHEPTTWFRSSKQDLPRLPS